MTGIRIRKLIESEEFSLNEYENELELLNQRWMKLPSTERYIKFLEFLLIEKEKFIEKLKNEAKKNE